MKGTTDGRPWCVLCGRILSSHTSRDKGICGMCDRTWTFKGHSLLRLSLKRFMKYYKENHLNDTQIAILTGVKDYHVRYFREKIGLPSNGRSSL